MQPMPLWKVAATAGGGSLTGAAVWLNAEHVASSEGFASPLVLAGVLTTVCGALTPPAAKRCARDGQPVKAAVLWLFFALAVMFSLCASIARSGGHHDTEVARNEAVNMKAKLALETYEDAKAVKEAECLGKRGPRCRAADARLETARMALALLPPAPRIADPGAERIAHMVGVSEANVALYSPLALPLAMELGGFILLATGLAPPSKKARKAAPKTKVKRKMAARNSAKLGRKLLAAPALRLGQMVRRQAMVQA